MVPPVALAPAAAPALTVRRQLDNGLTVLVHEVRTAPLVSVWCWYRVGSGDETAGLTGVSHWVEHMNFKGTSHIPRDEMKGLVERVGGTWNGYTWIDQTTYLETAAAGALERLVHLEAERMAHGVYDAAECEAERTVIISELQGGENDPDQLLDQEVTATALRVHPYGHPVIGWLQDLQSTTRDDLYAHYRRYYVPNNATLVIVGDVDGDDALRLAERHFGSIPSSTVARPNRQPEPPQLGERRVLLEREGTTSYVKLAWPSPSVTDPGFLPLLVLDAVLTGAKGLSLWSGLRSAPPQRRARLYGALVERGLASAVSGALLPTRDPFLYTISATAADDVPLEAVEGALLDALERVRSFGISGEELDRAQRQLRARIVFENDSITSIAHQLGYFETVASAEYLDALPERLRSVTATDVGAAARRWLTDAARTTGWFRHQPVR